MNNWQPYLDFAVEIAWQAGRLTLQHFQSAMEVMWKADESPVTVADRGAEALLRQRIEQRFPGHAIVGEEYGAAARDGEFRWILDPIDGTRSFVRGVPLYATLVALEVAGEVVVGVANFPALNEMVAAGKGLGATWNGRPCRVSSQSALSESVVCYTDHRRLYRDPIKAAAWERIVEATQTQRGWGDAYGHCLVATGRAEAMFDPIMSVWDCAALLPILQEAGGTFTDWHGNPTIYGEEAMSTNGAVLDALLQMM
ncbi:MAG: inositol monophosphatase family protein [Anaerolineales bacterium]|nr:inositol monophosphatase family protein [Anaerolineales bacterium]MCB9128493.1 inositol monophosphatase family protein [Ardenticatenales bacterium]